MHQTIWMHPPSTRCATRTARGGPRLRAHSSSPSDELRRSGLKVSVEGPVEHLYHVRPSAHVPVAEVLVGR